MLIGLSCMWDNTRPTIEYYPFIVSVYAIIIVIMVIIINYPHIYMSSGCTHSLCRYYHTQNTLPCDPLHIYSYVIRAQGLHVAGKLLNGKTNLCNYRAELVMTP